MYAYSTNKKRGRNGFATQSNRPAKKRRFSGSYAAKANRVVSSGETKYFDVAINDDVTATVTTWADSEVVCSHQITAAGGSTAYTGSALLPTAQGAAYGQVNGNKYWVKHFRFKGKVSVPVTTSLANVTNGPTVRVLLVLDKQPNGAQAQGEQVMQSFGVGPQNAFTFQDVGDTVGRFQVIRDKIMILKPVATDNNSSASTGSIAFEQRMLKLNWKPQVPVKVSIKSNSNTQGVAQTNSHNLFLLVFGITDAGSSVAVNLTGCGRTYYVD